MNFFRQPIFLVFFVIALIIAVVWNFYSSKQSTSTPAATTQQTASTTTDNTSAITNLTNLDPADFDSTLNQYKSTADAKALEVNKNYKLATMIVEIDSTLQPDGVNIRFVYNAGASSTDNWIISFSESSGNFIRSLIPSADYLGNPKQLDTSLWKFNYVTALQLAEKNGGLDFRNNNKDLTGITLTLHHTGPNNWLIWDTQYTSQSSSFSVQIDANSGQKIAQ